MPLHASVTVTAVSTTESTASNIIPMNRFDSPFNVGFGAVVSGTGEITYTVQHTFDGPNKDTGLFTSNTTWFDNTDVSGKTANADGNYAFPVQALRVVAVSGSGQGIVTLTVLEAGL